MEKQEYQDKLKELELKHSKEKEKLHVKYANDNNPHQRGDILQDHYQIILVEDIGHNIGFDGYCECNYRGRKLKKNLEPMKSGERSTMYQMNIEKRINR